MLNLTEEKIEEITQKIKNLTRTLKEKSIEEFERNNFEKSKEISEIANLLTDSLIDLKTKKREILNYLSLSNKFDFSSEEFLQLLSIPDIPINKPGSGKLVIEGMVGYRGLGIETIDHYLKEVNYEGVGEIYPLETHERDVSLTSFMYRVPPYSLIRPGYGVEEDEELSNILGNRFVWLINPKNGKISIQKTTNGSKKIEFKKLILNSEYEFEKGVVVPNSIELVDLSNKCIEVQSPYFYLKLGSSKLEKALRDYRSKRTKIDLLEKIKNETKGTYGLRFDYVYYCFLGKAISTDPFDVSCPNKNCDIYNTCKGKTYWSGKYFRKKPYPKVYPLRDLNIIEDGALVYEEFLPKDLIKLQIFENRRVNSYWYGTELQAWFINKRPIIRLYFGDNKGRYLRVGYSIPTSVIELVFNEGWIRRVVKKILKEHYKIRRDIAFKYLLKKNLGKVVEYSKLSDIINDLLEEDSEIRKEYEKYLRGELDEEFLNFAVQTLLHTLTHLFVNHLLQNLVGIDIGFILMKSQIRSILYPKNSIIIAENAKNGKIGIIDTILQKLKQDGLPKILQDFNNYILTLIENHDREFDKILIYRKKDGEAALYRAIRRLKMENREEELKKIEKVEKIVKKFKEEIDKKEVELDSTLTRLYLLMSRKIEEEDIEKIEDFFDDILEKNGFLICVDGCNACVRLERHCNEGQNQIFTTSKGLVYEFTKFLRELIIKGIDESSTEVGKVIIPLLKNASKSLIITSPYISKSYVEEILIPKAKNGVKVEIITWYPTGTLEDLEQYQYHLEAIELLRKNLNKNLEVYTLENLHEKFFIVDGKYLIKGSANLTYQGMQKNRESIEIKLEPQIVKAKIREFYELKNKSKIFD